MSPVRSSAPRGFLRRSIVALVAALAAVLVLTGCGLDQNAQVAGQPTKPGNAKKREHEPNPAPGTAPDTVPDSAAGSTSVPAPDDPTATGGGGRSDAGSVTGGDSVFGGAVTATGAETSFTFESTVLIDVGTSIEQIDMSGAVDSSGEPRLSVLAMSGDESEEVRIDGDDAWYASDRSELADVIPAGIEWIHVAGEDDIAADAEMTRRDLLGALSYLSGAEGIQDLGSSSVDGEELQTYSFVNWLGPDDGLSGLIAEGAVVDLTGEVDIDAQGRVRGIRTSGEIVSNGESAGQVDIEISFGGFGAAVDVVAPPADVTIDATGDSDLLTLAAGQIG